VHAHWYEVHRRRGPNRRRLQRTAVIYQSSPARGGSARRSAGATQRSSVSSARRRSVAYGCSLQYSRSPARGRRQDCPRGELRFAGGAMERPGKFVVRASASFPVGVSRLRRSMPRVYPAAALRRAGAWPRGHGSSRLATRWGSESRCLLMNSPSTPAVVASWAIVGWTRFGQRLPGWATPAVSGGCYRGRLSYVGRRTT